MINLLGHDPFDWQRQLYVALLDNRVPALVDIPTGLGKTSVMHIWLLALAEQARRGHVTLPRRLIWVVDRRVVVDQATDEAESIREKLLCEDSLGDIRKALGSLSCDKDEPLAISTLRGERTDNRQWSDDPSRPAIIVGTVDMIGSRLLFSGYGLSRRTRARQAGLLAHDTLLVNDEAHLTPVFAALVEQLQAAIGEAVAGRPPIRLMRLSATQRGDGGGERFPASLDQDEAASEVFRKRYRAIKRLELVDSDDSKEIEKLALGSSGRTIVFVRSPDKATKLAAAIAKQKKQEVPLITGELRGYERDRMIERGAFQAFQSAQRPEGDHWLVASSAGEVGVNLTCDHLITELAEADHLLQRFGRLNRFGETEGVATVVCATKKLSDRELATRKYLESLRGDASPRSLRELPPPTDCLSAEPRRAPLLPWHIDVWSMTSLTEKDWPSRPEVGPWLRGEEDAAPPETYVCWREETGALARDGVSAEEREAAFVCFRVLSHERLKQRTDRLCEAFEKSPHLQTRVLLVQRDGQVEPAKLQDLLTRGRRSSLHYATLVLPPGVGKLDNYGSVEWGKAETGALDRYDVSDQTAEGPSERRAKRFVEAGAKPQPPAGMRERVSVLIPSDNPDAEQRDCWRYYTRVPEKETAAEQLLDDHTREVVEATDRLTKGLFGPDRCLNAVFAWAAARHDMGKRTLAWQRYARNPYLKDTKVQTVIPREHAIAKSPKFLSPRALGGYRHELGSLLDALDDPSGDLSEEERDLALHLIAAHHGYARPHFPETAADVNRVRRSQAAAVESARRLARLQRRWGAWGLAYLEAVFCAADALGSKNAPENPPHE